MIASKKSLHNLSDYIQFSLKNIQVNKKQIMLTRSSERIFHPMRYTGYIYDYAHSFFGDDFNPMRYTYWYVKTSSYKGSEVRTTEIEIK